MSPSILAPGQDGAVNCEALPTLLTSQPRLRSEVEANKFDSPNDTDTPERRSGDAAIQASVGSAGHASGECKPCAWFWKPQGCLNGSACMRCHTCPAGEHKRRRKAQLKRLTLIQADEHTDDEQAPTSVPSSTVVTPLHPAFRSMLISPPLPPNLSPALISDSEDDLPPAPNWDPTDSAALMFPSVGSARHVSGNCKPCAWFWKPQGCSNGSECEHCHLCPQNQAKLRKQAKRAAARLEALTLCDPKTGSNDQRAASEDDPGSKFEMGVPPGLGLVSNLPPVPPPMEAPILLSVGSSSHGTGHCRPCVAFQSGGGCAQGQYCTDCHLCASTELRVLQQAELAGISITSTTQPSASFSKCSDPISQCSGGEGSDAEQEEPPRASDVDRHLPKDAAAATEGLLSQGSALHASGECTPCAWHWKPQGCQNGASCGRCHLCPMGEVKRRKKAKLAALQAAKDAQEARERQLLSPQLLPVSPQASDLQLLPPSPHAASEPMQLPLRSPQAFDMQLYTVAADGSLFLD